MKSLHNYVLSRLEIEIFIRSPFMTHYNFQFSVAWKLDWFWNDKSLKGKERLTEGFPSSRRLWYRLVEDLSGWLDISAEKSGLNKLFVSNELFKENLENKKLSDNLKVVNLSAILTINY